MKVSSIGILNANAKMTSNKSENSSAPSIAFQGDDYKRSSKMVTIPLATYMTLMSLVGGGAVMQSCSPEDDPIDTTKVDTTKTTTLSEVQKNTLAIVDTLQLATVKKSTPAGVSGMNRVSRVNGSLADGVVSLTYDDKTGSEKHSIVKNAKLSTKDQSVYDETAWDPSRTTEPEIYVRHFVTPITNGIKDTQKVCYKPPTESTVWDDVGGQKFVMIKDGVKVTGFHADGKEFPDGKIIPKDATTVTKVLESGQTSYDLTNFIIGLY